MPAIGEVRLDMLEKAIEAKAQNRMTAGYVLACKDIIAFMRQNMLGSNAEADAVMKLSAFIDGRRKEIESKIARGEIG